MKGCYISMVVAIICSVIISLCLSIMVGAIFYHKLTKKHKAKIGMLKAKIKNIEERCIQLEERYIKHEAKYHR